MNWNQETLASNYLCLRSHIDGNSNRELEDAFDSLRIRLASDVLPRHKESEWDHIRVEIWPSSGRVIVYPGRYGLTRRKERAVCELTIQSLLDLFEELLDSDTKRRGRRLATERLRLAELIVKVWKARALEGVNSYRIPVDIHSSESEEPFLSDEVASTAFMLSSSVEGDERKP